MKSVKNLLAAAILAFALTSSTLAGDVGFPPGVPPPPLPTICHEGTPVVGPDGEIIIPIVCSPEDEESRLLIIEWLIALSLLPRP